MKRFWSKVDVRGPGECWEWKASVNARWGYGQFRLGKTMARAHRVAWQLEKGEIPDGLDVLHTCDNRRCVNLRHLFLGTAQDNVDDMIAKGRKVSRGPQGETHPRARMTARKVRTLRAFFTAGMFSQSDLARIYTIAPNTVGDIVKNRRWKSV